MRRIRRSSSGVLVAAVLVSALGACRREEAPAASAPAGAPESTAAAGAPASAPVSEELIGGGRYLVTIMGCNDCHTPYKMGKTGPEPDMTRMLSGHPEN